MEPLGTTAQSAMQARNANSSDMPTRNRLLSRAACSDFASSFMVFLPVMRVLMFEPRCSGIGGCLKAMGSSSDPAFE